MKVNYLGKIKNPERYIQADCACIIDNSYEAMLYLKEHNSDLYKQIGCNSKMVPIMAKLKLINMKEVLYWAILDEDNDIKFMISAFDLFDYPDADILKFKKIENDSFFIFEDILYRLVFTSTGEAIIKTPMAVWSEKELIEVLDLRGHKNTKLCTIYPVKLFNKFTNELICCCWAVEKELCTYWYPISFHDESKLMKNDAENITEIALNVNDTIKVDKLNMVVRYSVENGFYLEKTNMIIPFEGLQMPRKIKEDQSEDRKTKRIIRLQVNR